MILMDKKNEVIKVQANVDGYEDWKTRHNHGTIRK